MDNGGVQIINHDASVQVVKKALQYPWIDRVGKISIGNNVFIGNHSILMPGIEIGNNCIIGAGTVVSKSVPENSVVAGNPMRVLCSFDDFGAKCLEHSDQYPWNENTPYEEMIKIRERYFWEEGNLK